MRIVIDTGRDELEAAGAIHPLDSEEAFRILSTEWLRLGLKRGYWTTFSWLGRQLVQFPGDALLLAEVIHNLRPDVILETGVYEGGSSLLFATLCRITGAGRVISVEQTLRPGVRELLAAHRVTLVEGDSATTETAARVRALIQPGERVFVFLDSDHSRLHVLAELQRYAPLVTPGSYIVVADTILEGENTPSAAVTEFLAAHPEFIAARPQARFHTSEDFGHLSYFAGGWLYRRN